MLKLKPFGYRHCKARLKPCLMNYSTQKEVCTLLWEKKIGLERVLLPGGLILLLKACNFDYVEVKR